MAPESDLMLPFGAHAAVPLKEYAILDDEGTGEDVSLDPRAVLEFELIVRTDCSYDGSSDDRLGCTDVAADQPVVAHRQSAGDIDLPFYGAVDAQALPCGASR